MRSCLLLLTPALAVLLLITGLAGPVAAWYPRTTQVELGTATWCTWCPLAYDGIEADKGWFDRTEFNAMRYYASSGNLGCPTSTTRLNYYGLTAYPTAVFDGTVYSIGSNEAVATGRPYRAIIESLLDDPAYLKITINSYDLTAPTGSIDLDIEVMEDLPSIANTYLRMMITEDNLPYGTETYQDVTRGGIPDIALTVDGFGEIQHVVQNFNIDPAWNDAELEVNAFVQRDSDHTLLASATTRPTPDYALRYYALGERMAVGTYGLGHVYQFDIFRVYNAGNLSDNYTITASVDGPQGWTAVLCDPVGGICYGPVFSTTLAPGEYVELVVDMEVVSSGYGTVTVDMTQDNYPVGWERQLHYTYCTDGLEVLLVDDDGVENYEQYFTDVLDHFGYTYGVVNRIDGAPSADLLAEFPAVIWNLGLSYPTLDASDQAALAAYLDGGGRLFVSGQDLGSELDFIGGAAYEWYQDYLHAAFVLDNAADHDLTGVAHDPISDGIDLVIQGGDGADNQDYPDAINAGDGTATVIFNYNETRKGAIRADTGVYKVVYFAFGFEGIDNVDDRRVTLRRILRWFTGVEDADDGTPAMRSTLDVTPSPVMSGASIRFTLPGAGNASLKLFAPDGRLVRTLVEGSLAAGVHTVDWDRTDGGGQRLPAGVYYYRLQGQTTDLSRKVVLIR